MFANLVESSSHRRDYTRRGSFFLGTLAVYGLIFLVIGVASIYAYNTHIENQNLELISLITPIEQAEVRPVQPRVMTRARAGGSNSSAPKVLVVKTPPVTAVMDPTKAPNKVTIAPPVTELPPGTEYKIGTPSANEIFGSNGGRNGGDQGGDGSGGNGKELEDLVKSTPPPPVMKSEESKPPAKTIVRSAGPVNGKATYLPKPIYSALAKAARAAGVVTVEVLIDESGKVVSARAISGNPLLLRESVQAAYQARFSPTKLGGLPVKVSGLITYNFMMQ